MSTTLVSIIETRWKTESPKSYKCFDNLEDAFKYKDKEPGDILTVRSERFSYDWYRWTGENFELVKDRKYKWSLLKWKYLDTGVESIRVPIYGSSLRDYYFGTFSPCKDLLNRSLPYDCSDETRRVLEKIKEDGGYDFTNVTLDELISVRDKTLHDLKKDILECTSESEFFRLNVKLDHVLELLGDDKAKETVEKTRKRFESEIEAGGNPEYFYTGYKDRVDYLFGEALEDYTELDNEIAKIQSLIRTFFDNSYKLDPEDIRIYYFKE